MKKIAILLLGAACLVGCGSNPSSQAVSIGDDPHDLYSQALKAVGTELISLYFDSQPSQPSGLRREAPRALSEYAFVGMLSYCSGLFYAHDYYDSSERIVKFEASVRQGESVSTIGFQTNIRMDLSTGDITFRCSQGTNADHYYAMVVMDVKYDLRARIVGDFYLGTTSLDENHQASYCQVSERKRGLIADRDNNEDTLSEFQEKLNPYIQKIPNAYLEEDPARIQAYTLDYETAVRYFNSFFNL